jgi:hypothetical protein
VAEKLESLRGLEEDWDGQGAVAPPAGVVDFALDLARRFQEEGKPHPDFAIAGVNGTVVFEWHLAEGFLQVEVTDPDRAERSWLKKGADVTEVSALGRGA